MTDEYGKMLKYDLKEIKPTYTNAEGQKKLRPKYWIWVIMPFFAIWIWNYFAIEVPANSRQKSNINLDQSSQVNEIVQATNVRMTEVKIMELLAKQLTPENRIIPKITNTPSVEKIEPTIQNDILQTGLDPNEVMRVLQNLPAQGRYRMDGINEMVTQTRTFKLSFYFPPYGGINCYGRYLCSTTASGKRALEGVGYYLACPASIPFGTKIIIFDKEWICEDRGSAITEEWLDLLYPYMPYGLSWGQSVTVKIIGKAFDYATITTTPLPVYPTITTTLLPVYPTITKTPEADQRPTITKTPENMPETKTLTPTKTITSTISPTPSIMPTLTFTSTDESE